MLFNFNFIKFCVKRWVGWMFFYIGVMFIDLRRWVRNLGILIVVIFFYLEVKKGGFEYLLMLILFCINLLKKF